jgi:putative hydrolase of HD superfamily
MDDLKRIRKLYELKRVERTNKVGNRKESSAEHTWSCIMLADYLLDFAEKKINRLKVYDLLLYHDVVEIESGDISIADTEARKNKAQEEQKAALILQKKLPKSTGEKFVRLFSEYEAQETIESRFAKGIDRLDALIHELDNPEEWVGWNEEKVRQIFGEALVKFPIIDSLYETILKYVKKNKYYQKR